VPLGIGHAERLDRRCRGQSLPLHRVAKARKRPVAELVREAIREKYLRGPLLGPVAIWAGPLAGSSSDHDSCVRRAVIRAGERIECAPSEVRAAMKYFARRDLHRLSLVDATSFVLMRKHKLRVAFAFDTHFSTAGFRLS
jgi:hypothetical protein